MESSASHAFTSAEREAVYKAIYLRRDMRHFDPEGRMDDATLQRLLRAAHAAPSVGLMQPWRFVRIRKPGLRRQLHELVEEERQATAEALGERKDEFMRLKVEGLLECAELLVVTLMDRREEHIFGRRTMPEMDLASASCAIQNLWLAARSEGLGMGWVSIFDPARVGQLLGAPEEAKPIAILCLGPVHNFYEQPMLIEEGWAEAGELPDFLMEDGWDPTGPHR